MPNGFSCKLDIQDAFRLLPIHKLDVPKLCFKIGKHYYFDKVLPQGCGSSCALFERFSSSIHHIFHFYAPLCKTVHYLDDFLLFAPTYELCLAYRDFFIKLCTFIGVPLAPHKITLPAKDTTFLGIVIDTQKMEARLPKEKITKYVLNIQELKDRQYLSLKQLQSIIGQLSFATAVLPGRVFLRRLIQLLPKYKHYKGRIILSKDAIEDLDMWISFLQHYNGVTLFRALRILSGETLNLQADASKKGFGATFKNNWLQGSFPLSWQKYNIAVLEFFPLLVLVDVFGPELMNATVIFFTDNQAVYHILQELSSKHPAIIVLLRELVALLLKYNIDLRSEHVMGKHNTLCDLISRFQVKDEILHQMGMNQDPLPIPSRLQPSNYGDLPGPD